MKELVLIVCCLLGASCLKAQQIVYHPFPDVKAKWVVTTMKMEPNMNIITYNDQYSVKGDTLINGLRYFKFTVIDGLFSQFSLYLYRQDTAEKKIYLRDLVNNSDFQIYNFNWNTGDTVFFFDNGFSVACNYGIIYGIDSILDENDNTYRKVFKLFNDENTTPGGTLFSEYTDGLGYNFGPNQAFFYTEGLIFRDLTCFTVLSSDTCYVLSLNEQQTEKNAINTFPNPASEILTIQAASLFNKINIYSSIGSLVNTIDLPDLRKEFSFNLKELNPGVYMLHVISKQADSISTIKFIKN
jgi:hypothetical protein